MKKSILLYIYSLLSIIFWADVAMSFYGYSYAGYYSDKIIGWLWLFISLIMIIGFWKKRLTKIVTALSFMLVLLSILPMMVPFYSIVFWFYTINNRQHIMLTNRYRIERTKRSALSMEEVIIFKRIGILEHSVSITPWYDIAEETVKPMHESFYKISPEIEKANLQSVSRDSICIRYTIHGTTGVFCHVLQ